MQERTKREQYAAKGRMNAGRYEIETTVDIIKERLRDILLPGEKVESPQNRREAKVIIRYEPGWFVPEREGARLATKRQVNFLAEFIAAAALLWGAYSIGKPIVDDLKTLGKSLGESQKQTIGRGILGPESEQGIPDGSQDTGGARLAGLNLNKVKAITNSKTSDTETIAKQGRLLKLLVAAGRYHFAEASFRNADLAEQFKNSSIKLLSTPSSEHIVPTDHQTLQDILNQDDDYRGFVFFVTKDYLTRILDMAFPPNKSDSTQRRQPYLNLIDEIMYAEGGVPEVKGVSKSVLAPSEIDQHLTPVEQKLIYVMVLASQDLQAAAYAAYHLWGQGKKLRPGSLTPSDVRQYQRLRSSDTIDTFRAVRELLVSLLVKERVMSRESFAELYMAAKTLASPEGIRKLDLAAKSVELQARVVVQQPARSDDQKTIDRVVDKIQKGEEIKVCFVCTANMNRSAIAHILTENEAKRLNKSNLKVVSGGLVTEQLESYDGKPLQNAPVQPDYVLALQAENVDLKILSDFKSQQITEDKLNADLIVVASSEHKEALISQFPNVPGLADKIVLFTQMHPGLAKFGDKMPDPQRDDLSKDELVRLLRDTVVKRLFSGSPKNVPQAAAEQSEKPAPASQSLAQFKTNPASIIVKEAPPAITEAQAKEKLKRAAGTLNGASYENDPDKIKGVIKNAELVIEEVRAAYPKLLQNSFGDEPEVTQYLKMIQSRLSVMLQQAATPKPGEKIEVPVSKAPVIEPERTAVTSPAIPQGKSPEAIAAERRQKYIQNATLKISTIEDATTNVYGEPDSGIDPALLTKASLTSDLRPMAILKAELINYIRSGEVGYINVREFGPIFFFLEPLGARLVAADVGQAPSILRENEVEGGLPIGLATTRAEVEAIMDILLVVAGHNEEGVIPLGLTETKFAGIEVTQEGSRLAIQLMDPREAVRAQGERKVFETIYATAEQIRDAEGREAARRQAVGESLRPELIQQNQAALDIARDYKALNSISGMLLFRMVKELTEDKYLMLSLGVYKQDAPKMIEKARAFQKKLENMKSDSGKRVHVLIELVNKEGERLTPAEESEFYFKSDTLPEGLAPDQVERSYSGVATDALIKKAGLKINGKAASFFALPEARLDDSTWNFVPYGPVMNGQAITAVGEAENENVRRTIGILMQIDAELEEARTIKEVPPNATAKTYEGRLSVKALAARLSQDLYMQSLAQTEVGASA